MATVDHAILPDWTEALTLLAAGFLTAGRVTVGNLPVPWMGSELAALAWMGADWVGKREWQPAGRDRPMSCGRGGQLRPITLNTSSYPGINTDAHPILAACLTQARAVA